MKLYTLHYTEALLKSVVWAFWRRVTGWKFLIGLVLMLFSIIGKITSGDRSWWLSALIAVFCLGIIFSAAIYIVHYKQTIGKFRRMTSPQGTFEVGETHFKVTSDMGSSELAWKTVTEIWQFPEFWLLFFSPSQFITLPLADLDLEARSYILDRAKTHGTKIK